MSDKLKALYEDDDLGLLNLPKKTKLQTSSDRLEASFLEIVDFYSENGRKPSAGAIDMAERKLGVRLIGILVDDEKVEALKHLDNRGLLAPLEPPESIEEVLREDSFGLLDDPTGITTLKNVTKPVTTAEYKAHQRQCKDFYKFEPLFVEVQQKLKNGEMRMKRFMTEQQIAKGEFFVLRGQVVYVAERGVDYRKHGKRDARLRVIYENGTESDLLSRALARGLYRGGSRIVGEIDLLADAREEASDEDKGTGYIYVLSSMSDDPQIANIQNLYKIGFSNGAVEDRIKNASRDPTFLMADVKIVAAYKTFNMNTQKLENMLHKIFSRARLNIETIASNTLKYVPNEWYIVPIDVIDQAIALINNAEIVNYYYDNDKQEISLIESQK
jgi:hypothetical protein